MRTEWLLLVVLAAVAEAAEDPPKPAPANPIWEFLRAKYDADHDGRVAAAEYDRGATAFARLDADGDGFVTADDLERRDKKEQKPFTPEQRRAMIDQMAPTMLVRSFGTGGELLREDLDRRTKALDADADGALARAEIEGDLKARGLTPFSMMGMGNFDVLARAADKEPDAPLPVADVEALFVRFDVDRDGALRGGEIPDIGKVGRHPRPHEDESNARAAQGKVAPDFDLSTPDGARTIKLSSFRDQRPVALIFGSFT